MTTEARGGLYRPKAYLRYTWFMALIGERRAVAAAVLIMYAFFYAVIAMLAAPPGWENAYFGMSAVYGVAFFGVVAGYFWARWYALGVAISGAITAGVGIWQVGPEPIVLFLAGTHLAAVLALTGNAMRLPFEGQAQWRKKMHLDDNAVARLGKSVTRAAISVPYFVLYLLSPSGQANGLVAFAAVATGAGLVGLVRTRTWSLVALVASSAAMCGGIALGAGLLAVPGAVLAAAAVWPWRSPLAAAVFSKRG